MDIKTLFKEKPSWSISLVLSIIYIIVFVLVVNGTIDSKLLFGFCVWGSPVTPTIDLGCSESPINSHIIAFWIDAVMATIGGVLYFADKSPSKQKLLYIAVVFIILAHGTLHYFLDTVIDCYEKNIPPSMEDLGYVLFAIFAFVLCVIIIGFGFGLNPKTFVYSIVFAGVSVVVTKGAGGGSEYVLPGLFCIVHPLSSFVGLFAETQQFSSTVGWWFVIATIVGITELSSCAAFFRSLGGHFYYDLTLHSAILASLPYFTEKASKKGKKA